jgi:SNF2 family DNA or RNA helicase/HJR/Mrr/RecB family endonuclease
MTIQFHFKDLFAFYIADEDGCRMPVSKWEEYNDQLLSPLSIINELYDNGNAHYTLDSCEVETTEILKLSEINKLILGLPPDYSFEIYIQSDGQLNQNSFKFNYGFFDFAPNGTRLNAERNGPILSLENSSYLLSESQFQICEALDGFNNLSIDDRTFQSNLKCFSDIKSLSKSAASILDSYLDSQNVYCPDKIKIDVNFINGELEIIPSVELEDENKFLTVFDRFPRILENYPVSDSNGNTTRIVINDKQKAELKKVKEFRKIQNQETISKIVENPENYFDGEEIDFSVFYSERVKEIGVYKPKFYPFVCPYKSEWIPGVTIKDKVHGEKKVFFKTQEILSSFIEKRENAYRSGEQSFNWDDIEIPLVDADRIISSARKQFENQSEPIKIAQDIPENEVLIIKENAEFTEFVSDSLNLESITHSFYKIDSLSDSISLKDHQVEGISWLQSLQKGNYSGCLLADDMGLGKTLQLLYFIEWHSKAYSSLNKPFLIVAPVSLLENWENEYNKFFSPQNLSMLKLYGSNNLTRGFDTVRNQQEAQELQRQQVILTSYETLRIYQATLCLVDYAVVALDEAQKIKTPGTFITNACKALKADFKIAMTGTPVENTLIDIWCIMDFSVPGLLGNAKEFAKVFQNPLKSEETDVKELTERLRDKIGVFIKRRLKKDVAKDLPKKHDGVDSRIKKAMPSAQLERYKVEIDNINNSSLEGVEGRNQKLKSIWAVRDISDHPYLLDNQILNYPAEELILSSSKLQTTIGILEDIRCKNQKAIVFADRKETQKMLQKVFYEIFGVFSSIINGDTPSTKQKEDRAKLSRQQTIDRFQSQPDFNVIIMSPLAAGVGLNVTEANHVIHYSRHWNPAKEEQATDRAYRIGQLNDVYVYYPMAVFPEDMTNEEGERLKSFDEVLDSLLRNKKALASNTLFPTEQAEVKPDEIFGNIFGFQSEARSVALSLKDLDKLNPNLFEAAIAATYMHMGYDVHLTPYSNDKGVDVVVLSEQHNAIIQVKQTKSQVGREAIQEIVTAKRYYESKFNVEFELIALTNNDFSSTAKMLANSNLVELINRDILLSMFEKNEVTIKDINKIEAQRLQRV